MNEVEGIELLQNGGESLLAGYVAHSMGLPIKMVAAVTPNDIVHRTLQVV